MEKKEATHHIDLMSLMTLLVNLHLAAQDRDIGQGNAEKSLKELTQELTRSQTQKGNPPFRVPVSESTLESCLWSCNMMNEKGKFWTPFIRPKSTTFNSLLEEVLHPDQKFDKFYNVIKPKRKFEIKDGRKN